MSELPLKTTPLNARHVERAARMVPFAGYEMPVQYEGVSAEHRWTRQSAGLFDVSHMGQARLLGEGSIETLEALTALDAGRLKLGRQSYALLLSEDGGILDDWMVSQPDENGFFLVVNAACKDQDFQIISENLKGSAQLEVLTERALLALQGPAAKTVMAEVCPAATELYFMDCGTFDLLGEKVIISRSGYTGEDGFEISISSTNAVKLWDVLLSHEAMKPVGLGARDSLRLEAGMPLYGHEMNETYAPFEAGLGFGVAKTRLERGDVRGQSRHVAQKAGQLERIRVGLKMLSGPPAREGAIILGADGEAIGIVTSGVPSPSLGVSIGMGYVPPAFAATGTALQVEVRGKAHPAEVVSLPFVTTPYHRKPKI
ncbi:MAG: glycine cleavage system aminomethyltransferase GcvT [Asticcacaulis sp.]